MLQLVDLKVPPYTIRGQSVRLECHYDLEGEALYSVKWFKDDMEFFRFYPEDDPPAQMFRVHGVHVDVSPGFTRFFPAYLQTFYRKKY